MKELKVNQVREENNIEYGYVVTDLLVLENLKIIIPEDKLAALINIIMQKEDMYTIFRYCQLVCLFKYQTQYGMSLQYTDYKGDQDKALDEYSVLKDIGWTKNDRDTIMRIFSEIKENPLDLAHMVSVGMAVK